MKGRWAISVVMPAFALATMIIWFGCEQKGDMSPTGTNRHVLTFIDTVIVDPPSIGVGGTASIGARILNESNEPARGEDVRFSVNRGVLGGVSGEVTIASDTLGWARTTFRAPGDTGNVLLRTELISMSEMRAVSLRVTDSASQEGTLTMWSEHDTLFADNGISSTRVYARLRNEAHNPIRKVAVHFSTTVGTITSPQYTDSLTGVATATLVSTTELGRARVTGSYGNSVDTVFVTFVAPAEASSILLSVSQPVLTAGIDSAILTARVFDSRNLPVVDNTLVSFSASSGIFSNPTSRTIGGVATTRYFAPMNTGRVDFSATTGASVVGNASAEIAPGPTAMITVYAASDTLLADNDSETEITVQCVDAFGNSIMEGATVTLSATEGTVSEAATVGPNGLAHAIFRSGLVVGRATITARNLGVQGSATIYLIPTTPASIALMVSPLQLVADGQSQAEMRATVLDADSRPVSDGTEVLFTAELGQINAASGLLSTGEGGINARNVSSPWMLASKSIPPAAPGLAKTNDVGRLSGQSPLTSTYTATTRGGVARATLVSPTSVGIDSVAAAVAALADRKTVTYVAGAPASIRVSSDHEQIPADGVSTALITCRVMDAFGNIVPGGLPVNVSATSGQLIPSAGFTNPNGEFVTTLVASRQRGVCAVFATAAEATGYVQVAFVAPEVASVSVVSSQYTILANGLASCDITATAQDEFGIPVSDVVVTWGAGPGIGLLNPLTTTTDDLGRVYAVFYSGASQNDEQRAITARVSTHVGTCNIRMTGVSVSAWLNNDRLPADGQSTTRVNVLVRETSSGHAIINAPVRFAASSGSIMLLDNTDSSGVAISTYRAGTAPGDVLITCSYGDTLRTAATLRLTGTQADSLHTVIGASSLLANGVSTTTVTATVYNEGGQAVPGIPVSFAIIGPGEIYPSLVISDSLGLAVATYRSAALTGDTTVIMDISMERGNETGQLLLRGVTINVTSEMQSLPANGEASTNLQVHLRETTSGVGISGALVYLGVNLGSATSPAMTNLDGTASSFYRSATEPGTANVVARYGNLLTDTVDLTLYTPAAQTLAMEAYRPSLLSNGADTTLITLEVSDQSGAALPGAQVTWELSGGGRVVETQSVTNISGRALNWFISPASESDHTSQVTARVQSLSRSVSIASRGVTFEVTADAATLPANGRDTTGIWAQIRETTSLVPVQNARVWFGASSGGLPGSALTDVAGRAHVTLIAAATPGVSTVVGRFGNLMTDTVQVSFYAQVPERIEVSSSSNTLRADGISTVELTARVYDALNVPLPNVTVTWSAVGGLLNVIQDDTDADGISRVIYRSTASPTDVLADIRATAGSAQGMTQILERGVTVSLDVSPELLPADGSSIATATAHLYETTTGVAISQANVAFGASLGTITSQATTNAAGLCQVLFSAGLQGGIGTIVARFGNVLTDTAFVTLIVPVATYMELSAGTTSLLGNGTQTTSLSAVVTDQRGIIMANAAVNWSLVGPGSLLHVTTLTDEAGIARNVFTGPATVSDVTTRVVGRATNAADSIVIQTRGVTVDLTANPTALVANGSSTSVVSARVYETSTSVAVVDVPVAFGATLGTIPASAMLGSNGVATVTYTAGIDTGTARIVARFGNLLTDTAQISLFTPAAYLIDVSARSVSLLADGMDTTGVTAYVTDQLGVPLRNAPVTWVAIGGGSFAFPMTLTDSSGRAANYYTTAANAADVNARVIARCGGRADTVTIQCRGITISVSSSASMIRADGVSTAEIRALVRETTNLIALPYRPVRFATSHGAIPATANTDAAGIALVELRSPAAPGVATVTARYGYTLSSVVQVTCYQPTPQQVTVSANSNLLRADGVSSTMVYARVLDELSLPIAGERVIWSAVSGQLSSVETLTDSTGLASVIYLTTASTQDRLTTVTAIAGNRQGYIAIQERGLTVALTATPEMMIADGNSTSSIRAHIYETSTYVAISGQPVTFGTTLGTIPNNATTDASGLATVLLRSSTQTGVAAVQARYGNLLTAVVNVTFSPSTPTSLSLSANPTVLLADNMSTSTITAVVTDQGGNPVPNGTQIRFVIPAQGGSMENLRTTLNGVATNTLTSSLNPGVVQIVAFAAANENARDSISVRYIVGAPAVVNLSAQSDSLRADGIAVDTITAHVTDAVGHALPNVEVHFTTTIGNITASRVTDQFGNAAVSFSSSQTGTAQIVARTGEVVGVYTIYLLPGNPNSISMEYFPNSVGVRGSGRNETLLITATVRDANNNPVTDGTPVYFNLNNSPGGGDFLSSGGPIPTINGRATVSYNSGIRSGSTRVRATSMGVSAVSTEILVFAGPPYIEDITDGCRTSHMAIVPFPFNMFGMDWVGDSVTITALVGDRYNNPVTPGTAVYFTTTGGVITTATGYTDTAGFARVTLYSGNPRPTIGRWMDSLRDPNFPDNVILCSAVPARDGVAKVVATTAGVTPDRSNPGEFDSVLVWASTDVIFNYRQSSLELREMSVEGNPNLRELYIGESALIRIAAYDIVNYWPLVYGSTISFSSAYGRVYPNEIMVTQCCDTSFTATFFNNLSLTDDDAASPVLITVDTRFHDNYVFTETFLLRAALPPGPQ